MITANFNFIVKIFSLKQKTNEILQVAIEKLKFFSSRKRPHVPSDYNL